MALIVAFTNIIPYVGPIIGGTPAVLVAFFDSPTKALLVIVVILVAQQIEGNFLSPMILGKSLDTHPATIIIILLAAGNLAGVLGMVLGRFKSERPASGKQDLALLWPRYGLDLDAENKAKRGITEHFDLAFAK